MKSKVEIKNWILNNCVNEHGNIDLSCLDFLDFNGDIDIGRMKVRHNLLQDSQCVGGMLYQSEQVVNGDLYQNYQRVCKDLHQDHQKVGGDLYRSFQSINGSLTILK